MRRNRFQFGFLLGSLLPLFTLCLLGHSERVSVAAGAGFLLIPALLWPRRVGGWLVGLGGWYERVLRPARSGGRQNPVSGPCQLKAVGVQCAWPTCGCPTDHEPANANPTPESDRRRQDVFSALQNLGRPKRRARQIAETVAGIPDENERLCAAMRMVRV